MVHRLFRNVRRGRNWFCRQFVRCSPAPTQPDCEVDPAMAVVWVPTSRIDRCLSETIVRAYRQAYRFDFKYWPDGSRVAGLRLGGHWDRFLDDVASIPQWRGFEERYAMGRDWAETSYYRFVASGACGLGMTRWLQKTREWDLLFEDMRVHGYRVQESVRPALRYAGWRTEGSPLNEIQVVMARSGELVRVTGGGKHRFMMARILEIPEIPVVVNVWHPEAEARLRELRGETWRRRTAVCSVQEGEAAAVPVPGAEAPAA
jgi:hypothetical protein